MVRKHQPLSQLPSTVAITAAAAIRCRGNQQQLTDAHSATSRRALLGAIVAAPRATLAVADVVLVLPLPGVADQPLSLRRTREGRQLSRVRYHTAESFFAFVEEGLLTRGSDELYQAGIVLQLALSSHLLDIGFDDVWCARNIGLHVNKSLACANATGLGHECPELARFAEFLSPYGRWRNPDVATRAIFCPFSHQRICRLARELLDHVREVTGHPRPRTRRG
jgi:hypothetical protein